VVPTEAFVRAAVGFFNARQPLIEVRDAVDSCNPSQALLSPLVFFNRLLSQFRPTILDSFALGCAEVAQDAIAQSSIAVIGAVFSECTLDLNDVLTPAAIPSLTPASTANALTNKTRYPYVARLTSSSSLAGIIIMRLLTQAGFDCFTLVESASQQASLEARWVRGSCIDVSSLV
jgi:hypothetical protein